jgi:hypothetical protein
MLNGFLSLPIELRLNFMKWDTVENDKILDFFIRVKNQMDLEILFMEPKILWREVKLNIPLLKDSILITFGK